jgi:feruloyl esterase
LKPEVVSLALLSTVGLMPASVRAASCESLMTASHPNMTVTLAQTVAAGQFTPPSVAGGAGGRGGGAFGQLPAFCRVAAVLRPVSDSEIGIEIWLPATGWNGKLQSVGNGAWAGTISYAAMATAVASGYVAASTDTGHVGGNANFMVGHPEKLIDFEYRAVHEMTGAARRVVAAFYGNGPRLAYFNGCSTGGRQALTTVQRYPADYDGVIAGAPANYAKHQTFGQIWLWQATHKDEASFIPSNKYQVIHDAVLKACDRLDGVADGVLEDPTRCTFDPKVLQCTGADSGDCLTASQVEAARKIYAGASNPRTNEPIYPGLERGSELGWGQSVGAQPVGYALDFFKYIVFKDANWDPRSLNYDSHLTLTEKIDTGLNAVDADLTKFIARGAKLLMYHGWSDPGIPPRNLGNYYKSILKTTGDGKPVRDSVRAFMVPGMGHCGGGEGVNTFDLVAALDRWVETKRPPDAIPASRVVVGQVVRTRPLCPYPQVASYKGAGDTSDAANFVCN